MIFCSDQLLRFVNPHPSGFCPAQGLLVLASSVLVTIGFEDASLAQDPTDVNRSNHVDTHFEKSVRPILVAKCYECHGSSTEQNG
jgi:hypothetical protein